MRRFAVRLLEFLGLTRRDAEARREIEAHLALMQEDFENRGLSPDAAHRAARVAFGGVEQTREAHRDARSFRALETARQDIALGVRLLRRSPLVTITAAGSLAIGIGGNTAIFAVANTLLFRPPDGVQHAERLVDIGAAPPTTRRRPPACSITTSGCGDSAAIRGSSAASCASTIGPSLSSASPRHASKARISKGATSG
jgi:hypothetical protein